MKEYNIHLPDPECGLSVPIIVPVNGENIFEAVKIFEDALTFADRLSVEGLSIMDEPVKKQHNQINLILKENEL